ncbi:MAG: peptidyl-prolyl cis-trans isomerase [Pseudomonadota bacterium]
MATKKKLGKTLGAVLVGLLIVSLMGFAVSDFGASTRAVAKVGDTEIDTRTYANALQADLQTLSRQMGTNMTLSQGRQFGIDQIALGRLIEEAALENEAALLGLSVGDQFVADEIARIPNFQSADGFNREAFVDALRRNGTTVREFNDEIRADTARNILRAGIVGGLTASDTYIDTLYNWARETRDVTLRVYGPEDLDGAIPAPTEAELTQFHEENPELFTIPETRVITYALLTPQMILDTIDTSDEDLRREYDARIDQFVEPERRLVERLIYPSTDEAAAAKAALDAGEKTFEDLVSERGLELSDIDLGDVSEADLDAAGAPVFALTEPGIAGPIDTSLGPAFFRVNAILAASETTFEEAREELAAELSADRAGRVILDMSSDIDDLLAGGATIEDLGSETEMETGTIEWRPDMDEGIAAYAEFRAAAQTVTEDDFPELILIDEGGAFALRLDEILPPRLQPLGEIREEVTTAWTEAQTVQRVTEQAQAAGEVLETGDSAAVLELGTIRETGIARDGFIEGMPGGVIDGIFQMAEGDVRVFQTPTGAALVRVDTVIPPSEDDPEGSAIKAALAGQVDQSLARDALQMFSGAIQNRTGIDINQQAINAIHAQFP